jgi:hypothetical protein
VDCHIFDSPHEGSFAARVAAEMQGGHGAPAMTLPDRSTAPLAGKRRTLTAPGARPHHAPAFQCLLHSIPLYQYALANISLIG